MVILGIDPGTASTGYGLIDTQDQLRVVEYGCIRTSSSQEMVDRLKIIYKKVKEIVQRFYPEEIAIEQVFFNRNTRTALSVGQARGVIMLAASCKGAKIFSYTPLQVKQAVTGYGKAKKRQVQRMVKKLLNLPQIPTSNDAADAMAIAVCHYYSRGIKRVINSL